MLIRSLFPDERRRTVAIGSWMSCFAAGAAVGRSWAARCSSAIGTVATDLIVGTAPPERAGAASGISETSGGLGGALGVALLGSIGKAVYRAELGDGTPAARETLGGAVGATDELPAQVLEEAARAFVDGLQVAALAGAALMAATAALVLRLATRRASVGSR